MINFTDDYELEWELKVMVLNDLKRTDECIADSIGLRGEHREQFLLDCVYPGPDDIVITLTGEQIRVGLTEEFKARRG